MIKPCQRWYCGVVTRSRAATRIWKQHLLSHPPSFCCCFCLSLYSIILYDIFLYQGFRAATKVFSLGHLKMRDMIWYCLMIVTKNLVVSNWSDYSRGSIPKYQETIITVLMSISPRHFCEPNWLKHNHRLIEVNNSGIEKLQVICSHSERERRFYFPNCYR